MLRRLHSLVLRRLPGPFFAWLGILMFLLLMQFLIRWLPEITGKGIPFLVIVELIVYNLAYMVVLAVPMSVLLATLMAFGDLAESKYYTVIKSTGISFGQVAWPALGASLLVFGGMLYFNNVLLPEANHRARQLWRDIRTKRPGFELQPGVFYDGIEDYSILVRDRPPNSNELIDVTIYDYTQGRDRQAVLKAKRGQIESHANGTRLTLTLRDGEMHRPLPAESFSSDARYEHLRFDKHIIHFNLSDVVFQRSKSEDDSRSTRTMSTNRMLEQVDSLHINLNQAFSDLYQKTQTQLSPDSLVPPNTVPDSSWTPLDANTRPQQFAFTGLPDSKHSSIAALAVREARSVQSEIKDTRREANWRQKRIRSYEVEIYKKLSIAAACIVFVVIGAPLGLALRRGGLATIGAVALGIFMFYWVTLVQGEKMSERGFFPPWIGMWIANLLMSGVGVWLLVYIVLDLGATPPLRHRLWDWLTKENS